MAILSAVPFFAYAAIHAVFAGISAKRIFNPQGDRLTTWTVSYWLLFVGFAFVILDCIRLGLGGFWEDTTLEDPPAGAILYALAVVTHLLLVPFFIFIQAELVIATKWRTTDGAEGKDMQDTPGEIWFRRVSLLISAILSCGLFFNLYAEFMAYQDEGYKRTEEFGIVKYKWPSTERAQELGYLVFLPDLVGVIAFAVSAVVAGGVIWCRTGWPWYFVTAFIGLMGQGAGTALPDWFFFFTSNLFEIFSFAGQVIAADFLFNKRRAGEQEQELWQGS